MSITTDIYDRVITIPGIRTKVKKKRAFQESELPGVSVYPAETSVNEVGYGGTGYRLDARIGVEYHKASTTDPLEDWESMVTAIRSAVEDTTDLLLNDTLCEPLELVGVEAPELPDDAGGIVAAQVVYSAKYISKYGS